MSGNKSSDAYNSDGVFQHFNAAFNKATFLRVTGTKAIHFSCVDSRSEQPLLGTPGGDTAEFMGGAYLYFNLTGTPITQDAVDAMLKAHIAGIKGSRKFYLHTSDSNLLKAISEVNSRTGKNYVTLPDNPPAGEETVWYDVLSKGTYQGCGHIRLMIDNPTAYGLPDNSIPRAVLVAFFKYWWATPFGSRERSKVVFEVLQGPLVGKAVAIVAPADTDSNAASCINVTQPGIATAYTASQLFVYHQAAANHYRTRTLVPWFVAYAASNGKTLDAKAFTDAFMALHGTQLVATLKLLQPVANLDVYAVNLEIDK